MTNESDLEKDEVEQSASNTGRWDELRNETDPVIFAGLWLKLQIERLEAEVHQGIVVLGSGEGGVFAPVAVWPEGNLGSPALVSAIEEAIGKARPVKNRGRRSVAGSKERVAAVACPLIVDGKVGGAVGIETANMPAPRTQEIIAQLTWGCGWLESLLRRSRYLLADRLISVVELTATALHHDRFNAAATAVATELASALGCERVSIGFLRGKNARVAVVSHSASFSKKANVVRAIEAAMDEAIDQQATVRWPPADDGPLQVTRSHEQLATEHGHGTICTVPLAQGDRILGAIVLERPRDVPFDAAAVGICEQVAALLGPLLDVKRRDDRWLGAKALDSARLTLDKLFGPRHVAFKLVASVAVLVVLFFSFATGDFRVTVDARLEGEVQRAITTPVAGYVAEAKFRAGDVVKAGDELFVLDDRELRLEIVKWNSQKEQYTRERDAAGANRERARAAVLAAQIEQAEAQIALANEQLSRTRGRAPFDGYVVAGDLSQSLGAPVERGDVLFELAPLDAYRVMLEVEERDIAEIEVGLEGVLVLSSMPGQKLPIRVNKITPVSVAEEGVNYFNVEASLTAPASIALRPGMEGIAKIEIEERRLIWIWTYKIWHWLRMFFWSWWP